MNILQTIRENRTLYVFTSNPRDDISYFIEKYENSESKVHLWYEPPELHEYKFLGNNYYCISLWYDNEDDIIKESQEYFNKLKNANKIHN